MIITQIGGDVHTAFKAHSVPHFKLSNGKKDERVRTATKIVSEIIKCLIWRENSHFTTVFNSHHLLRCIRKMKF